MLSTPPGAGTEPERSIIDQWAQEIEAAGRATLDKVGRLPAVPPAVEAAIGYGEAGRKPSMTSSGMTARCSSSGPARWDRSRGSSSAREHPRSFGTRPSRPWSSRAEPPPISPTGRWAQRPRGHEAAALPRGIDRRPACVPTPARARDDAASGSAAPTTAPGQANQCREIGRARCWGPSHPTERPRRGPGERWCGSR